MDKKGFPEGSWNQALPFFHASVKKEGAGEEKARVTGIKKRKRTVDLLRKRHLPG
jgi:hypothetical protein